MDLNRCAYTILGILRTKKATDKVHGVTVKEVTALERISRPNTIHKRIKEMQSSGYVAEGVKAGRTLLSSSKKSLNEMSSALHNWKRTSIITASNPCRKPEKQYFLGW